MNALLRHDSSLRKKLKDLQNAQHDASVHAMPLPTKQENEEEGVFDGLDAILKSDYKVYEVLNAQQRYGFPDVIFVCNKVSSFNMTPSAFEFQRKFLFSMFKQEYFCKQGEIGNADLLG